MLALEEGESPNLIVEMERVREVHQALLRDYQSDFSKHSGATNAMTIRAIFNNVPIQLASHEDRTTSKYKFSHAQLGSTIGYQRLQTPIEWLLKAGLLYRVRIANQAKHSLELFCKDNLFKLYGFDVGLLAAQLQLPSERIYAEDYGQSKGYFAETLALQALVHDDITSLYAWQEGTAEIEFLTVLNGEIVPIEVKAGHNTRARSLQSYITRHAPATAIKFHSGMIGYDAKQHLHTLPLYLAWDIQSMDL